MPKKQDVNIWWKEVDDLTAKIRILIVYDNNCDSDAEIMRLLRDAPPCSQPMFRQGENRPVGFLGYFRSLPRR